METRQLPDMPGKGVQAVEIKSKIFDAHLHIIDPRFPLIPNQGISPSRLPAGITSTASPAIPSRAAPLFRDRFRGSIRTIFAPRCGNWGRASSV